MKKLAFIVCIVFVITSAFIQLHHFKSGIHGVIDPAEGASKVTAFLGTDSVSTIPVSGKFSLEVKPGSWTLFIEAVSPYRNTVLDNILVQENQSTDAGVIKLTK